MKYLLAYRLPQNSFNDYFTNTADDILNNRKYGGNKTFQTFLRTSLPNSFI